MCDVCVCGYVLTYVLVSYQCFSFGEYLPEFDGFEAVRYAIRSVLLHHGTESVGGK